MTEHDVDFAIDHTGGARDKLGTYLNPQALIRSAQALQRGIAATNGTLFQFRVEKVYFSILYSIIWNWSAVVREAASLNIPW